MRLLLEEGDCQYKYMTDRYNKLEGLENSTDPKEKRRIISTFVDHINVDRGEDKNKHVVEIIYKYPASNNIYLEDGT
ncbi:MAG: hypothetical protein ABR974_00260 [Bacteroidales bacterium]|jgi:hypothetical protein